MAKTTSKPDLKLECGIVQMVSYVHYASGLPLFRRFYIRNNSETEMTVSLEITSEFTLPFTREGQLLPPKTTVNIAPEVQISPTYFVALEESVTADVGVIVKSGDKQLAAEVLPVTLLGYREFCGTANEAELLAGFVSDKSAISTKILKAAEPVLKKWKLNFSLSDGYSSLDNNEVRYVAAAIYSSVQNLAVEPEEETGIEAKCVIKEQSAIVDEHRSTPTELALLYCSALRATGLNPVLVSGDGETFVGVWLVEKCFNETMGEGVSQLTRRVGEGVNEIAVINVKHLFNGRNVNFTASEKESLKALNNLNRLDFLLDIKRARVGGIRPLSERIRTKQGFKLVNEEVFDTEKAPEAVKTFESVELTVAGSREKQWERRLLDLSLKNSLLNFRDSASVHLLITDAEEFAASLTDGGDFLVAEAPAELDKLVSDVDKFETDVSHEPLPELVSVELKNKRIHSFSAQKKLVTALTNLYRKDQTFVEETGANSLYLGVGFLKWLDKFDGKTAHYAPIMLYPVRLKRDGISKGFRLSLREDEDVNLNVTLLEYLKQEFGLELRGLTDAVGDKPDLARIFALIRNEVLALDGWKITPDVYLGSLTFSRYMMWHDVKYRMDDIKKNPAVDAMLHGVAGERMEMTVKGANPDSIYTSDKIFLPINADSSQFAAVVDCTKKSFVLHGPPGTGKSQTITNMIACNLARGKRVLFVAEKMAALDVVKARLSEIGISDFCLELHSNKANKVDVAERIMQTLNLPEKQPDVNFGKRAEELAAITSELAETTEALHKKRKLGVSVYDGVVRYLEYQDAPDLLEIDNSFYERLDENFFRDYENTLSEFAACASEFGDVKKTPFKNVELLSAGPQWKARAEAVLPLYSEQLTHTRKLADLCLSVLGTKVRKLNKKRLLSLYRLCKLLTESGTELKLVLSAGNLKEVVDILNEYQTVYDKYVTVANRYNADFIGFPENVNYDLLQVSLEIGDAKASGKINQVYRKLTRVARHALNKEKKDYYLRLLLLAKSYSRSVEEKTSELKAALHVSGDELSGERILKVIESFNSMYGLAADIYADFDREAFNATIRDMAECNNYDAALGFLAAFRRVLELENSFVEHFCYTGDLKDVDDDYFDYVQKRITAISDNLYTMPSWVRFNVLARRCNESGLSFAVKALSEGRLKSDDLIRCFRKKVYQNFVETEIALDERLSEFSSPVIEELIDRFRQYNDEFQSLTREEIYSKLSASVQGTENEKLSLEKLVLSRAIKSRMKNSTLRGLFKEIPEILKVAAPCMLMSPISVAQYLDITDDKFDLVVFDEASQVPTAEAVGAMARGNSVVIVGDENQLPPTSFFVSDYADEENPENEDLESVLDDAIAIGMPEHRLLWHYRSKHESLISFSNAMYYDNKLLTFPSPNELNSKVTLHYVEGTYDRGGSKTNEEEANALVQAVIDKLRDPLDNSSVGVVTFSSAQRALIEDRLHAAIVKNRLEERALGGDEPLFVKNLENVQGDERDCIYFSVGYGPDKYCRLSLNFGPLNQTGGFRRLNVAVTRAKNEMHLFSSITSDMIDLSKTTSKGVMGLKAFLEFADKGKTMLAVAAEDVQKDENTLGYYIAEELRKEGVRCEYNLGDSGFKIDVAVVDPLTEDRYILAVLCDSKQASEVKSIRDRYMLEVKTLKQLGWNIYRMWTTNFLQNPKKEIKKVKAYVEKITLLQSGKFKLRPEVAAKYRKEYKAAPAKTLAKGGVDYLTNVKNERDIVKKIESIIAVEEPINRDFLIKKLLTVYSLNKTNAKTMARLTELLDGNFKEKEKVVCGKVYYASDETLTYDYFRPRNDAGGKRVVAEFHPSEIIAAARCVVESGVSIPRADLIVETAKLLGFAAKLTPDNVEYINGSVDEGVKRGLFIIALDNRITC